MMNIGRNTEDRQSGSLGLARILFTRRLFRRRNSPFAVPKRNPWICWYERVKMGKMCEKWRNNEVCDFVISRERGRDYVGLCIEQAFFDRGITLIKSSLFPDQGRRISTVI